MDESEQQIIEKAIKGDPTAFGMLVQKHYNAVYSLAFRLLKNADDALDITQDVFLRALQNIGTLQDHTRFAAWLRGITFNLCKNWLRKSKYAEQLGQMSDELYERFLHPYTLSPDIEYENKEDNYMLEKAIDAISKDHRLIIKLYYMDDLSYKEIATFLNVPVNTIGTRIFRARKQLQEEFMDMVHGSHIHKPQRVIKLELTNGFVIDSETGIKYTKINSLIGRKDIIQSVLGQSLSPDGRFMINGKLVIPLNDEESFEFTDMPAAGSSWSPDGSNIAFFTDNAIWVIAVSPKTAQPEGTAKKLMDVEYARPMNITWSPDSDKVAFERFDKENHGDIWTISVKDGTLTRITSDEVEEYLPSWSPDGKYIAYMKGYPSIWISPSDGGEPREIINRINNRAQIFWSPDSKWIIYMMGATVFYKLRLARIDDGCMFEIIIPDEVGGYLSFSADRKNMLFYRSSIDYKSTLRAVSSSGGQSFELGKQLNLWPHGQVWSSDGRMMIAHGEDKEKNIVLWVIPFSGGKPKILDFKVPIDEKPIYVSVSPDAQKLAFTIKHEDQTEDLYVVPISLGDSKTGESATMVFKEWDRKSAYNVISAWSPDSSKLAVIHEENIWIAYADGSNPVQLTKNLRHRTWPVWSPDSSMIAYSVNSSIDNRMLYIVSESSDEEIKLAESCETYRWSGDGNEITLFSGELISSISLCNREIRHIVNLRKLGVDYTWVFEWSPDGDRLAIIGSSEERDKPEQIFIINIIEGKVMELAEDDSGSKYSLSWSPDGKWLSYNSDLFVKTRPESKIWEADFDEILT